MKFTANEWEIISHRLEVGDCIADAILDGDNEGNWTREEIEERSKALLDGGPSVDMVWDLNNTIIVDAMEGSTFFCGIEDAVALGEVSNLECKTLHRAADKLEADLDVIIPRG